MALVLNQCILISHLNDLEIGTVHLYQEDGIYHKFEMNNMRALRVKCERNGSRYRCQQLADLKCDFIHLPARRFCHKKEASIPEWAWTTHLSIHSPMPWPIAPQKLTQEAPDEKWEDVCFWSIHLMTFDTHSGATCCNREENIPGWACTTWITINHTKYTIKHMVQWNITSLIFF